MPGRARRKIKSRKRRKNPAKRTAEDLGHAADLYEGFSGHKARFVDKVPLPTHKVGIVVGKCDGVLYTTIRDGKRERYIHEFRSRARPLLISSSDGRQLYLIGGSYRFTHSGIVDGR